MTHCPRCLTPDCRVTAMRDLVKREPDNWDARQRLQNAELACGVVSSYTRER